MTLGLSSGDSMIDTILECDFPLLNASLHKSFFPDLIDVIPLGVNSNFLGLGDGE